MKILNIKTILTGLIIGLFAIVQFGCEQDWQQDFEPSVLASANTATVSVNTVKDSSATIEYSLSTVGRIFLAVVPGTDEMETPDAQNILKLSVADAVFAKQIVMADASALSGSVHVPGLIQNTSYKVYALPVNHDGILGEVATTDAFTTGDTYKPTLDLDAGVSPAISSSAAQTADFDIMLSFDEPVMLASTIDIKLGYYDPMTDDITWIPVVKDSISINSNVVTIKQMKTELITGERVYLSIAEGSITDRSDNEYVGVESGRDIDDEGDPYSFGIYWRVSWETKAELKVIPVDTVYVTDAAGFDVIKLVYPIELSTASLNSYESSMIKVKYYTSELSEEYSIDGGNVDIDADTLFVYLPKTADYGSNVTLSIDEGTVWDVYGNDIAAIEFGDYDWFISYGYTRDMIYGSYTATCVSYFSSNTYIMSLTIAEDPDSDNGVLITGLEGSDSTVVGIFDGDLARITMDGDQSLGDLIGDGSEVFLWNGFDADGVAQGTIASDATITMSWGSYIVGGANDGKYYDLYSGSVWTKTSKKVNVTLRDKYVPAEKR